MALRKLVSVVEYEQMAVATDKLKVKVRVERKRYRDAVAEMTALKARLEAVEKTVRAQQSEIHDHSDQTGELYRIIDQLKRENEQLRLARDGRSPIEGNLKNIDSRVWNGMFVRTVSGGSAGTLGR